MQFKGSRLSAAVAVAFAALAAAPAAVAGGEAGRLALRDLGAKYLAYTTEAKDNGSLDVKNAMFVQYVLPAEPKHRYPVVMIHGGGGQGTDWLQTPDGRDGWVDYFVADGWDVYVVDRPGHGRSQSNPGCGSGSVAVGNSAIISRLATADANVWPGGNPTPTNDAVVSWTASSTTAPYCGDVLAAQTISALLDDIGPAILLAHSAGGGSTFRVPELNRKKVVGIIGFEAAGGNPVAAGPGGQPLIASFTAQPALPADFKGVDVSGCVKQPEPASRLVHYANLPIIVVGAERGLAPHDALKCQEAVWDQAGANASYVWLPDRGLSGGGHFAMAQLDNAAYARVFIDLAKSIEAVGAY